VLYYTQQIERFLGRTRKSVDGIYHDRPIDIDILLYDHAMIQAPDLLIPHPLSCERDFVMRPLMEVFGLFWR
jgi:2-amino-4-hydroxy-6-hydroxymethyldihydropteridine diphosphokinase